MNVSNYPSKPVYEITSFDGWLSHSNGFLAQMRRDGTMTIPAPIRQQLGLTPDARLIVRVLDDDDGFWVDCLVRRENQEEQPKRNGRMNGGGEHDGR